MAITWIEICDIPPVNRTTYGRVVEELNLFMNSSHSACEVDISRYKNVCVAQISYSTVAHRRGYEIKTIVRQGRLFLVKKGALKKC